MRERRTKSAVSFRSRMRAGTRFGLAAVIACAIPLMGAAGDASHGVQALSPDAAMLAGAADTDYVIGTQDKLSIRVFQVKDLSLDEVQVDATGQIQLPLIGKVTAAGKTAEQLQDEIAHRLGERYLQSPQVSVSVAESASQKVTVEGEVKNPGVYQMKGRTTLMQAIAMAGGPADDADLHRVAVIRNDHGVRKAAVCDYAKIIRGELDDPPIQGNDSVVIDGSKAKMFWSATLKTLPVFSLFAWIR
jgi:polysaccharide export outer membrane protein